jgi:hypothetical protein
LDGTELEESFIHFEEPTVTALVEQGANTHKITDLWMEIDGDDLGVWPTDRTVPFLPENDPALLFIFAGIKNNGIQDNAVIYPFYDIKELNKSFVPQATDTMTLDFVYTDETVFSFVEDFEGAHLFTQNEEEDENSVLQVENINGNSVGVLNPHEEVPVISVSTSLDFTDIPMDGRAVYLELDYMTDIEFVVGLVAVQGENSVLIPKIVLVPTDEFNKIYIDFTPEVAQLQLGAYRVFFLAQSDGTDLENQKVYLDNVKLVHF